MKILAGDIGGTKTILRVVELENTSSSYQTIAQQTYASQDFTDLVPMVQQFLAATQQQLPEKACFAIAGPVVDNTAQLTNLSWFLQGERLSKELGLAKVSLINDLAAVGYGILGLTDADLHTLQTASAQQQAPIAVIAAGTGLGQAFLIPDGSSYQVFPSEGGHTDFAPRNEQEFQLLQYLRTKLALEHISTERIVSGQGIVAIYQFLRDQKFAPESSQVSTAIWQWEQQADDSLEKIDPAAVISQAASDEGDVLCRATMAMFVEAYGAETGNLALKLLPYGGVYIAGGVAAKNLSWMTTGSFMAAFADKGRLSSVLKKMPVHVVLNPQVGVLGSVLYALKD